MKKVLISLFLLICTLCCAQVYNYRSNQFAYKYLTDYGYWTNWSDWFTTNINITINANDDTIIVYSKNPQVYAIYSYNGTYSDSSGGRQASFGVIDHEYDRGTIRLRVDPNGNSQLYVEFSDIIWVYSGLIKLN